MKQTNHKYRILEIVDKLTHYMILYIKIHENMRSVQQKPSTI